MAEYNELGSLVLQTLMEVRKDDPEAKIGFHPLYNFLKTEHLPDLTEGDLVVELTYQRNKKGIVYSQYVGRPKLIYITRAGMVYAINSRHEYYIVLFPTEVQMNHLLKN